MSAEIPVHVWAWRAAVRTAPEAVLPAMTRLLLHTIADYLTYTNIGDERFVSIERLAREAGMSERAVKYHTRIAIKAGYLGVERKHPRRKDGRKFLPHDYPVNFYSGRIPKGRELGAPDSPSLGAGDSPSSETPENQVHETTGLGAPDSPSWPNYVHDVHTTLLTTKNNPLDPRARAGAPESHSKRIIVTRRDPTWRDWQDEADRRDRALGDCMRAQKAFAIYVDDRAPWPGCSLPEIVGPANGSNPPPSPNSAPLHPKKGARQ